MPKSEFNVIIMHGHSNEYLKVKELIKRKGFNPIILKESYTGDIIFNKIRKNVWKYAHCIVVVMSPDDKTEEKTFRARQNVVFEMGYCLGAFDSIPKQYWYNAVILVKEFSVEKFADIDGLEYISYSKKITAATLSEISKALTNAFKQARNYYDELD